MNVMTMHRVVFMTVVVFACGACSPGLGDCDDSLARTVAYGERGVPAGFDFDMVVSRDSDESARLRDGVERVRDWAPNV